MSYLPFSFQASRYCRKIWTANWSPRQEVNKRIKQKIYIFKQIAPKIYFFCFILLFTSSSPCRKDQFAVSYFSTSLIVLIQVYNWEVRHHTVCCCGLADILYILESSRHCPFRNHKGKTNTKSITAKTDVPPRSSPLRRVSRGGTSATQPCSRFSDSGEDATVKGTRKVGGAASSRFIFSIQRARLSRSLEQASDSATDISYWWRNICSECGHKRWLDGPLMYQDASVSLFSIFNSRNGKLIFVERY